MQTHANVRTGKTRGQAGPAPVDFVRSARVNTESTGFLLLLLFLRVPLPTAVLFSAAALLSFWRFCTAAEGGEDLESEERVRRGVLPCLIFFGQPSFCLLIFRSAQTPLKRLMPSEPLESPHAFVLKEREIPLNLQLVHLVRIVVVSGLLVEAGMKTSNQRVRRQRKGRSFFHVEVRHGKEISTRRRERDVFVLSTSTPCQPTPRRRKRRRRKTRRGRRQR